METITGHLSKINFAKDGFIIGLLDIPIVEELAFSSRPVTSYQSISILGNLYDPIPGQKYQFSGEWANHPKFGKQFKFQGYRAEIPQDADGILRYITRSAKWVGFKVGKQIVETFGDQTLDILKTDPQRVADAIKGITLERAEEISKQLKDNEAVESAQIELETFLGGHRLPKNTFEQLIKKYGCDAPARIKENPYLLTDLRGIGFPSADSVAMALGYDREGLPRRLAAALHLLQDAADSRGHTWLPLDKFEEKMVKLIGFPSDGAVIELVKNKEVVLTDNQMLALRDLAEDETFIAGKIRLLIERARKIDCEIDDTDLADDQKVAIREAMAHGVFILTGAPGTGKTYTLKRIISHFDAHRIALAAPTGKAAKRMTEMIGQEASTIHRLLGPLPMEVNGETIFNFSYSEFSPLPADLVVIDEFSMVDVSLAASLLKAIASGTRLLIVGDHYQLPSVGPGSVLRDLIAAGVPSFELTEIKRNTGDIVQVCHAIKDMRLFNQSPSLDPAAGLNFRHIECDDPAQIKEIIRDIVTERMSARGYDPIWDVQVLSPMNERGPLSCLHLNELLQSALNPGPLVKGLPFREGDKVLQRKNEMIGAEMIVNGDLGTILEINEKSGKITVEFRDPTRMVQISRKSHHLQLAYCMTIHKLQGSEAPVIIFPVHQTFGFFFNRELAYTGISRARDICIVIGQWGALEQACRRVGNDKRITRLTEILAGK